MANTFPETEDLNLQSFLKYISAEKSSSTHTIQSYYLDILQFAKIAFEKDLTESQAEWSSVDQNIARIYIASLQELKLSKSSILRKNFKPAFLLQIHGKRVDCKHESFYGLERR